MQLHGRIMAASGAENDILDANAPVCCMDASPTGEVLATHLLEFGALLVTGLFDSIPADLPKDVGSPLGVDVLPHVLDPLYEVLERFVSLSLSRLVASGASAFVFSLPFLLLSWWWYLRVAAAATAAASGRSCWRPVRTDFQPGVIFLFFVLLLPELERIAVRVL